MIEALFRDGRKVKYTVRILHLLMADPDVIEVIDLETGELLKG